MAGVAVPNLPTNCASSVAITEREAERDALGENATPFIDTPGDGSFDDPYLGMNRAGGCNPGVGINTGDVYQSAADLTANGERQGWTLEDQNGAGRTPQDGQLIGGVNASMDPADNGSPLQPQPPVLIGEIPVTMTTGADINNTANFVLTDTAAADGAVMDTVTGAINNTGDTVGVGDHVWGQVPIA